MADDIFSKNNVIAVVGASRDKSKYGYKIFHTLLKNGFNVYAINPNAEEIDGKKCYKSLSSLPEKPDVVITVTKPEVTLEVVKEAVKIKPKIIWMQPGSESKEAEEVCRKEKISYSTKKCYIVDGLKTNFIE